MFKFLKLWLGPCLVYLISIWTIISKPSYLLNHRSDSGDSCAQTFLPASRSFEYCLFRTYEMFVVLFYLLYYDLCFRLSFIQTCWRWINIKTFKSKTLISLSSKASVLDACCTYFLYLSLGMHTGILVGIVGILCVISFYELSLLSGLGRTLVILRHA
jgi:hypothetical protein